MSEVKTYRVEFVEDRFSKWMSKDDHDRVVAHLEVSYQNQIGKLNETIAAHAKVIEKLKEQRGYYFRYANTEFLKRLSDCDAELAALTKQPEPKEGV